MLITYQRKNLAAIIANGLKVIGNPKKPDENVEHYKKKLQNLYEKFNPFLNDEWNK